MNACVCFFAVCVYSRTQVLRRQRDSETRAQERRVEEEEQSLLFILSKEVKVSLTEAETLLSNLRAERERERNKEEKKRESEASLVQSNRINPLSDSLLVHSSLSLTLSQCVIECDSSELYDVLR